eukprot:22524_1
MAALVQWYLDQIVTHLGLIVVVFVCVVAVRNIKSHKQELQLRLRILLYAAHILSVISHIALVLVNVALLVFRRIAPTWNQHTICVITYILVTITAAGFLSCVINLFFERLCVSFEDTPFKVSKCTRYSFRIIVNLSWVIVGSLYLSYIDPLPYNIYTNQVANLQSLDGVTCSAHVQGADPMITVTFSLVAFIISSSNLVVWALFMHKLRVLITDTHTDNVQHVSKHFICLMKEQTMLIGIAVFSSVILWTLEAIFQFGHAIPALDIAVTTVVMFLTFPKLSGYYFSMLKCDKLTVCCCGVFEKYISLRISREFELSEAMHSQAVATNSQMPTTHRPTTTTVVSTDKSKPIV